MNRRPGRLGPASFLVVIIALVGLAPSRALAQSGPSISLDKVQVNPGDPIIVTLVGFTSQQVTVAVCGNLAKRGSSDCNMPQSQSERIRANEDVTLTQLFVQPPPVPCPCIVRATGTNGEFAIAPIDLIGHAIEAIVSPEDGPLVELDLTVDRRSEGFSGSVRAGLGAATTYAVTVRVRNITTEPLTNVALRAKVAHRLNDDAAPMQFDRPGPIEPGQTWTQTIDVELPAPHIGRYTWTVVASGAGPTVDAAAGTNAVPILLFVLAGILVLDLLVLVVRSIRRRRRRRRSRTTRPIVDGFGAEPERTYVDEREPVGVS
jgi:hypothetical protein